MLTTKRVSEQQVEFAQARSSLNIEKNSNPGFERDLFQAYSRIVHRWHCIDFDSTYNSHHFFFYYKKRLECVYC